MNKLPTGIPGFDIISAGGLPQGRVTLVAGAAGCAKTIFCGQFLAKGIEAGEPGVFVTFEESPADIRQNLAGFGWTISEWEEQGVWTFVDVTPDPDFDVEEAGDFDLAALIARVRHAVERTGAKRVSIDSISAAFQLFDRPATVRRELGRLVAALKALGVTTVLSGERSGIEPEVARYGLEEFVCDNVVILRNRQEDERRRRTVEVLKVRGAYHQKGEWPFTVVPGEGITVLPLSAMALEQRSSDVRVPTGVVGLDEMAGGGFFRDSIILVSGATGTGKTLLSTQFLAGGAAAGERCLLLAFEESRDQLTRNARGWGVDFGQLEAQGLLQIDCTYPESASIEDHLIRIRELLQAVRPQRISLDSVSALARVASPAGFREFVIALTSYLKQHEITGLLTCTSEDLMGGPTVTDAHISTITDTILLLRYVEFYGEVRRGVNVLKMRGSGHDKHIREYRIDGGGMHIEEPFHNVLGILSGDFRHVPPEEVERLSHLFH